MNRIYRTVALSVLLFGAFATNAFGADEKQAAGGKPQTARAGRTRSAPSATTKTTTRPILSLYQTRHGVMADSRTPACQSCHGLSDAHVKNTGRRLTRPCPTCFAGQEQGLRAGQAERCVHGLPQDRPAHALGGQPAPEPRRRVQQLPRRAYAEPTACWTRSPSPKLLSPATRRSARRPTASRPIRWRRPPSAAPQKWRAPIATTRTARPVPSCWSRTRSTRPASPAMPKSAARSCGSTSPVVEDCTNCHTPHGSNITPLLKSRAPFLCDECHDGPHNSRRRYGRARGRPGRRRRAGRQSERQCRRARLHELPRHGPRLEFAGRGLPASLSNPRITGEFTMKTKVGRFGED